MRFQYAADRRGKIPDDRPGQEHSAGFSAHHAGTDHMVPDPEIIFRPEMLPDQHPQPLIPGHHNVAHPAALLFHGDTIFMQYFCLAEESVPGIRILFFQRSLKAVHHLVKAAGLYAVPDRPDRPFRKVIYMRKKHGIGGTFPDLLRPDIDRIPFRIRIDVQKQLSRIHDLCNRTEGMSSADDREKRDSVQNKKERTGNTEKIAHHQISRPGGLQLRKTVKYIKSVPAFPFNHPVDLHRKSFKPVGQRYTNPFHFRAFRHKFRMTGKTEIDDIPPVPLCLFHKGICKAAEFFKTGYAPDHIISHPDIIESLVQRRNS